MLTSSFTLAKGLGDLNGQVAALMVLQQVGGFLCWRPGRLGGLLS
jgi:hypothetical protein